MASATSVARPSECKHRASALARLCVGMIAATTGSPTVDPFEPGDDRVGKRMHPRCAVLDLRVGAAQAVCSDPFRKGFERVCEQEAPAPGTRKPRLASATDSERVHGL